MSDGGGHGEGQHDQSDVAMPAVPGAGLVVVEAELVLGGLEAVLDGPAVAFDQRELAWLMTEARVLVELVQA